MGIKFEIIRKKEKKYQDMNVLFIEKVTPENGKPK